MASPHQIRLLVLSVAVVTVSTLPVFLTGAAFFEIGPELGIGPFGLGLLTAAFFLTASAASPGLGRWVQRVGWRRAMRVNVVASAVLVALIAPLARSALSLAALLMAAAVMYGSSNPAANQALARHTSPRRTATVFGLKHAGIPASTLLAGLAVPAIVVHFGWRLAFVASALLALSVWFLIPRGQEEVTGSEDGTVPTVPLTTRDLRRLAAMAGLGAVAAVALGTFMVSAALEQGWSESGAGWLQFAGSGTSVTARVVAGITVDRRGGALAGLVGLLATGSALFLLLAVVAGPLFGAVVLAAYATGWGWPGLMTAAVVGADRETAAATSAVTQAGVFIGAGGGPILLGALVEQWSYPVMWGAVGLSLAIAAVVARSVARRVRAETAA
jgi:MFS family permease